jgi:hypothetical protein
MLSLYVGYVSGTTDEYNAGRIRAVIPSDKGSRLKDIPYAFPAMPKMVHVKPKNGEAVIVLVSNDKETNGQRYYIGPIISQPDKMLFDNYFELSPTRFLGGGIMPPTRSIDNEGVSNGAMPKDTDIALMGRKNTDVILGEDDVRIRAGVRLTKPEKELVEFNRDAPAYIKLKHHDPVLDQGSQVTSETGKTRSTATIVADKINLVSWNGDEAFKMSDPNEGITDDAMKEIIEKAHKVPYGDVLIDFIMAFMKMYRGHFHADCGMPPGHVPVDEDAFNEKFGTRDKLEKNILSDNIRIN